MPELLPEYMGYDRTIAVFSPDGRLFQVEYAKEAVKRGLTSLGITYKEGVLLATVKIIKPLLVTETTEKIFQIDDHLGAVAAGLLADARVLIDQARIKSQVHKITYEEPIDVVSLAKFVADKMQLSTLYAGLRPYGTTLLIGGMDSKPHLIEVDPSGMIYEWQAYAIGRGASVANKILKEKWKPGMSFEQAKKLAEEILQKTEKEKGNKLSMAVIDKKGFRILNNQK